MEITVDNFYKSLNKFNEELCGDKVEILKTHDSNILILADGMGSGVKANILATLTSKILGTMLINGSSIDECVQTIVNTLPICKVRELAYSTFSILQIFKNGEGYLVEFDNPSCIFIRDGRLITPPFNERIISNQSIKEYRFRVKVGDCFVLLSDGVIHAGVGQCLNFGWTWEHVSEYALNATKTISSASRLANTISDACRDLYLGRPGDDTTVAVTRIIPHKVVNLFTGPPVNREDDHKIVDEFMRGDAKKVVCGGTSALILSRVLDREIKTSLVYSDPTLPPVAKIEGINLVTEGVLTLTRALNLLKNYAQDEVDEKFFLELDEENGGSQIAKLIIEECSHINMYVGNAVNSAHQNPELPFDLNIRMHIVKQFEEVVKKIGKTVSVNYY
ncbi:MAG: SpoIIE family protein phosphatase [Fusobacteriaceae bacterium]